MGKKKGTKSRKDDADVEGDSEFADIEAFIAAQDAAPGLKGGSGKKKSKVKSGRDEVEDEAETLQQKEEARLARELEEEKRAMARVAAEEAESGLVQDEGTSQRAPRRVPINSTAALTARLASIRLPPTISFIETLALTHPTPLDLAPEAASDDLRRELAFYDQALHAAVKGLEQLRQLGVPTTRPVDYFAEMVKADAHMLKVKQRIAEETTNIKKSEEAKKQREQKRLGKKVQQQREQEKREAKARDVEKLKQLKRKRGGGVEEESSGGGGDDFGVTADADMDDESGPARKKTRGEGGTQPPRGPSLAHSKRALSKHAKYSGKTGGPKHGSGRFEKQKRGAGGFGEDDGGKNKGNMSRGPQKFKGKPGTFNVRKMKEGFDGNKGKNRGKPSGGSKRPGKDARAKFRRTPGKK
ncbi:eukaryotic rRNA processing [Gonapodya prolifera JEL478]|uniref:Eukaryotic rRNA processing n=1 Tax=Gonapodya prolifera (strain JEL478) TaxID=1344416 RepID=A0A139AI98_GONPJ|nr:eukaryotic rRNA processing [Gonapodya prolifera JEL478]|eukprot:KXS16264.1 eukaryotic rRNA processing [Gonapodya prolifera JEL478]